MFSTSKVHFYRQNTLNLTNTNLVRRGKNNNPFQRDSYLQNINTILCIVIKYKTSIQYWHVTVILIGKKAGVYFHPLNWTCVVINNNSNAIINVYVKQIIRHLKSLQMLWYVTFYCYHFWGSNREVCCLHFEGPFAPYNVHCGMPDWNLRIHWNPLCKWKRHFISRLSGGFVCKSTSPSTYRRSDPSGETTIIWVSSFLSYTL